MTLDGIAKISPGFAEVLRATPWWGWGMLLVSIFIAVALGKITQNLVRSIGRRLVSRGWNARGLLFTSGAGAINLAIISIGLSFGLAWIVLTPEVSAVLQKILAFLYTLAIGWYIYNLVDLISIALQRLASHTESKLDDAIVPLVKRSMRIFVVVVFFLFVAQNIFGANISAWLAGLGVAGLAVSLAAQDSIKNLFGSITIYLDHTFSVGDRIVFDGNDGAVEEIGFRSTKLRLGDGSLVTIPNSKIVDGSVRNVQRRPNIQRVFDIGITYDTAPDKIERAIQIVKDVLHEPDIESDFDKQKNPPRVAFDELKKDSLNIKVWYWFNSTDYWNYVEHAQRVNLRLIRAFADAEIEFAFPSHTVYLAGDERRQLSLRMARANGENGDDARSLDRDR
jgi:MscS family membrane protein